MLRYDTKPKEAHLIDMCCRSPLPFKCIQYLCENTVIDFNYQDDQGRSMFDYIWLWDFVMDGNDDDDRGDNDDSDLYNENAAFPSIEYLINQYINHLLQL